MDSSIPEKRDSPCTPNSSATQPPPDSTRPPVTQPPPYCPPPTISSTLKKLGATAHPQTSRAPHNPQNLQNPQPPQHEFALSGVALSADPQYPRDWPCPQPSRFSPVHPIPQYPVPGPGTTSPSIQKTRPHREKPRPYGP